MSPAELAQEDLLLAFTTMIPVVASALAGAVIVGALAAKIGVRDPTLTLIARAIAVIVALTIVGGSIAAEVVDRGRARWGGDLVEAGR
ncbi:MAG: flagellar biosynthetic protein FliQ [Myxococcales bacterium]|nr:flagellar biosynthetic protein FliQ [Myxococcales bacterium]MCB9707005.1 flagellar biosynthetic protein FliQ [Myxococcales bacterium]